MVDSRAEARGAEMSAPDPDLIGTCAFVAAYLRGLAVDCLWEGDRDRGFAVFGLGVNEPRIWDPLRHSFVYVDPFDDQWRLYDFASARHFRVTPQADELIVADELAPSWTLRVVVHHRRIQTSGLDGERRFHIRPKAPARIPAETRHVDPVEPEALPDPFADAPVPWTQV
jgi:hypothetical protein